MHMPAVLESIFLHRMCGSTIALTVVYGNDRADKEYIMPCFNLKNKCSSSLLLKLLTLPQAWKASFVVFSLQFRRFTVFTTFFFKFCVSFFDIGNICTFPGR